MARSTAVEKGVFTSRDYQQARDTLRSLAHNQVPANLIAWALSSLRGGFIPDLVLSTAVLLARQVGIETIEDINPYANEAYWKRVLRAGAHPHIANRYKKGSK